MVELTRVPHRTKGKPNARVVYVEAPTSGWNYRAQTKVSESKFAAVADNVIIDVDRVRSRPGYEQWNSMGAAGRTMMNFSNVVRANTNLVIGATDTKLFDVTVRNTVTELQTAGGPITFTSGYWDYVQYTNLEQNFIVCVNGTDGLHSIDNMGEVKAETVTDGSGGGNGFDANAFHKVTIFKNRVYLAQKDTQKIWYLEAYAKDGVAGIIDTGTIFRKGGEIINITPWTHDGGEGLDDYFVAITSGGEAAIWKGIDPASATPGIGFELVGVFVIDGTLGDNNIIKYGGDLIVLTETGPVAIDNLLKFGSATYIKLTNRDSVDQTIRDYFRKINVANVNLPGWQILTYQYQSLIIINIPNSNGTFEQVVKSTVTDAWSRFRNINATSFVEVDDFLFFCDSDGEVYRIGNINSDNGAKIACQVDAAWSYHETPLQKHYKLIRSFIIADSIPKVSVDVKIDFDEKNNPSIPESTETSEGSLWGEHEWGEAEWGNATNSYEIWSGASAIGTVGSITCRFDVLGSSVAFTGWQVIFEQGGPL